MSEFVYLGDARGGAPAPGQPATQEEVVRAVYFRDNPAGPHGELWHHAFGCRSWLRVVRDTRTHLIIETALARAAQSGSAPALSPVAG